MSENTGIIIVDSKKEIRAAVKSLLLYAGFNEFAKNVLPAFPSSMAQIPCVSVLGTNFSETGMGLGDMADTLFDDEEDEITEPEGTGYDETFDVRVWTLNADERDQVGKMLRGGTTIIRNALTEKGLSNIKFSGGNDSFDYQNYGAPIHWYISVISMFNPVICGADAVEKITRIDVGEGV